MTEREPWRSVTRCSVARDVRRALCGSALAAPAQSSPHRAPTLAQHGHPVELRAPRGAGALQQASRRWTGADPTAARGRRAACTTPLHVSSSIRNPADSGLPKQRPVVTHAPTPPHTRKPGPISALQLCVFMLPTDQEALPIHPPHSLSGQPRRSSRHHCHPPASLTP